MKYIVTFFILFNSLTSFADDYYKGTVVYLDGKARTGLIDGYLSDVISFKTSEKAQGEKIQSSGLISVSLQVKDELREFWYVKTYSGWGQKKISDPMWLRVIEKGTATLMVNNTTMRGSISNTTTAGFSDYYCIRKGEPAAKWISAVSGANNNQMFRAKAPLYFADYPELAEKIKSKEYKWKDLEIVVKEYNKWALSKK